MKPSHHSLVVIAMSAACAWAMSSAHAQKTRTPKAGAGQVVIYRCTDAAGHLTLQNGVRCPKGQKQEARVLQAPAPPAPAPAPVIAPVPSVAASPAVAAPVVDASAAPASPPAVAAAASNNPDLAPGTLPPPPIYRCHAHSGNSYLSEDGDPKDRCVSLTVTDVAGGGNRSGAEACEVQQDRCERVPDAQLCEAWSQYDRQAESLVALDNPELAGKANALHARTRKVMTATTCAAPAVVGAQNP